MSYDTILYEVAAGVATITLNRPDNLNAFNDAMIQEATAAFKQCEKDKTVRCVVLTGAGRGFCSGQDLADVKAREGHFSIGEHLRHGYHLLIKRMVGLEKPIIGAINGVAAGAGVGLALATDIRVASEKASFVLAFSKVGLIPDCGTNWLLPRIIGQARAYQMAITAEKLPAGKALEWGMVNEVTAPEELTGRVQAWASQLAEGASLSFAFTKRAMTKGWEQDFNQALEYESYLQDTAGHSADHKEGVAAFLEKRPPKFVGK
jgi:2-(1,2-epoxy-1,2-dihydrophenyl)acetyl-CoA isomerase